jgi:sensor domain CHASE-containing protein
MEKAFYAMLLVFIMATIVFIVLMRQLRSDQDRSKK